MRRMRDFPWAYLFLAAPAIAVAVGIQYSIRHSHPLKSSGDETTLKPSAFREGSDAARDVASEKDVESQDQDRELDVGQPEKTRVAAVTKRDEVKRTDDRPVLDSTPGGVCSSIEFKGDGPDHTKISQAQWARVMKEFHGVKGDLLSWLDSHKQQIADKTAKVMDAQIRSLRLQRPPQQDEPDLNWRGIGVFAHDATGVGIVRMGSGFVKLMEKQPSRARFELARLVAQAWSPCEIVAFDDHKAWDPLLQCLGVSDAKGCA